MALFDGCIFSHSLTYTYGAIRDHKSVYFVSLSSIFFKKICSVIFPEKHVKHFLIFTLTVVFFGMLQVSKMLD